VEIERFPGGDLVGKGLRDLEGRRETVEALLVSIAAPRLRDAGLSVSHPYPDLEIRSQVSRAGAEWGFWVGSDEIVFFKRSDPLRFMSARVRDSSTGLDIAEPVELFAVPGARAGAVSRDGRTFAAVLPVEPDDASEAAGGGEVRLVLNWHRAVER
jgi:hypothetical protein